MLVQPAAMDEAGKSFVIGFCAQAVILKWQRQFQIAQLIKPDI